MRRLISITLLILISFSGIRISIAYHFCGGEQVSARISLSDRFASCGMEDNEHAKPSGTLLGTHCCDNVLSDYTLGNNYLPVTHENDFSALKTIDHQISGSIPEQSFDCLFLFPKYHIKPPGTNSLNKDIQPVLCVFRI
jgi:hypothetical protein